MLCLRYMLSLHCVLAVDLSYYHSRPQLGVGSLLVQVVQLCELSVGPEWGQISKDSVIGGGRVHSAGQGDPLASASDSNSPVSSFHFLVVVCFLSASDKHLQLFTLWSQNYSRWPPQQRDPVPHNHGSNSVRF